MAGFSTVLFVLLCHIGISYSICPSGHFLDGSDCKTCPRGTYIDKETHVLTSCFPWTQKPPGLHWILKVQGSHKNDQIWVCEEGYKERYVSELKSRKNCVSDDSQNKTSPFAVGPTTPVSSLTNETSKKTEDSGLSDADIAGIVIGVITMCICISGIILWMIIKKKFHCSAKYCGLNENKCVDDQENKIAMSASDDQQKKVVNISKEDGKIEDAGLPKVEIDDDPENRDAKEKRNGDISVHNLENESHLHTQPAGMNSEEEEIHAASDGANQERNEDNLENNLILQDTKNQGNGSMKPPDITNGYDSNQTFVKREFGNEPVEENHRQQSFEHETNKKDQNSKKNMSETKTNHQRDHLGDKGKGKNYISLIKVMLKLLSKAELNNLFKMCNFTTNNQNAKTPQEFHEYMDEWESANQNQDILDVLREKGFKYYVYCFDSREYINVERKLKGETPMEDIPIKGELRDQGLAHRLFTLMFRRYVKLGEHFFYTLQTESRKDVSFIEEFLHDKKYIDCGVMWVRCHRGWNHIECIEKTLRKLDINDIFEDEDYKSLIREAKGEEERPIIDGLQTDEQTLGEDDFDSSKSEETTVKQPLLIRMEGEEEQ